jgi:virulence-associated protein VagC
MDSRPDPKGEREVATKARITKDGLLIPKDVAERALGEGHEEVEIVEEPGRLLISPASESGEAREGQVDGGKDPILALGEDPVDDPEVTDASVNHDRYLYTGG